MSDEEQQAFEKTAMMQCSNCERMIYNDGSQDGGDAFCQHRYGPIGDVLTPRDDVMSNRSRSPPTNEVVEPQFVEPTLPEAAAMHELTHNLRETQNFKKKLEGDLAKLHETLDQCEEDLNEEFEQVVKWVTDQKTILNEQLRDRYNERCDLLVEQIKALKKHEDNAKDTKKQCHLTIQSMDLNDPEREKKIINNCSQCIKSNPLVNEVPINLAFSWGEHDRVNSQLQRYGKLNFRDYKSGARMEYTSCDVNVHPIVGQKKTTRAASGKLNAQQQQRQPPRQQPPRQQRQQRQQRQKAQAPMHVDNDNDYKDEDVKYGAQVVDKPDVDVSDIENNGGQNEQMEKLKQIEQMEKLKEIALPKLRRVNMRYKPNQNHELKFEPILRDPEFGSNEEEKEYEDAKGKYVFLHIQCMGNFDKKTKIGQKYWDSEPKRYEIYTKLPRPDQKGKYYVDLPNNRFKAEMAIHARARLIFLMDEEVIDEHGMVNDENNLIKQSKWSEEKITHFKGAPDHVCIVKDMADEHIQAANNGVGNGMGNGVNGQNVQPGHVSPMNPQADFGYNNVIPPPADENVYEPAPVEPVVQKAKGATRKAKVKCEIVLDGGKQKMKMFAIKPGFTFQDLISKTQKAIKSQQNFLFTLREDPDVVIGNDEAFVRHCVDAEPDNAGYNAYLKAIPQ